MFVSVIIPSYDNPKELQRCLQSLESQLTSKQFELIVIDDCSPIHSDKIKTISRRYKAKYYRNSENLGPGISRNKGAQISEGEIIAFIDSDCIANSKWLDYIVDPIIEKRSFATTSTYIGPALVSWLTEFQNCDYVSRRPQEPTVVSFIDGCNFSIVRKIFCDVKGFKNIRIGEDIHFGNALTNAGSPPLFIPEAGHLHHYPENIKAYCTQRFKMSYAALKLVLNRQISTKIPNKDKYVSHFSKSQVALSIALNFSFILCSLFLLCSIFTKWEYFLVPVLCGVIVVSISLNIFFKFKFVRMLFMKQKTFSGFLKSLGMIVVVDMIYLAGILSFLVIGLCPLILNRKL